LTVYIASKQMDKAIQKTNTEYRGTLL